MYSIGHVSKQVGIKIPTLRYYEEAGLVPAPSRSHGQQRRYDDKDVERLLFVKHARQLGFSLASIASLLELSEYNERDCAEVHALAESHLSAVTDKLLLLRGLEQELKRIVDGCADGHVGECYVIQSLAEHSWCSSDHD